VLPWAQDTGARWRRSASRLRAVLVVTGDGYDEFGAGKAGEMAKARRSSVSLPLLTYSAPGGLRQGPGRAAEWPTKVRTCGNGGSATAGLRRAADLNPISLNGLVDD
jgi:hypothetical protein